MANLLHIALLIIVTVAVAVEAYDILVGLYHGMEANNLPPPSTVAHICNKYNISRIRLSEPNANLLEAFRGMDVEVTFGLPNSELPNMAVNPAAVEDWFNVNVQPFVGYFVINYIIVGDKAIPGLTEFILPVMKTLQNILNAKFLGQVKITTLLGYYSALAVKSPPSCGEFDRSIFDAMGDIIEFLSRQGSPLMISAYPYRRFAYDRDISFPYAQFGSEPVVFDGNFVYTNALDEMVDTFYAAMELVGDPVPIVIGETGWPWCGINGKATPGIAGNYNRNFIRHISSGKGTPRKPNVFLEGFIESMYSENMKPEGDSRCYGVFYNDSVPVYPLWTS